MRRTEPARASEDPTSDAGPDGLQRPGWELSCRGLAAGGAFVVTTLLGAGILILVGGEGLDDFYGLALLMHSPLLISAGGAVSVAQGLLLSRVRHVPLQAAAAFVLVTAVVAGVPLLFGGLPVSPRDRTAYVGSAVLTGALWALGTAITLSLSTWRPVRRPLEASTRLQ